MNNKNEIFERKKIVIKLIKFFWLTSFKIKSLKKKNEEVKTNKLNIA